MNTGQDVLAIISCTVSASGSESAGVKIGDSAAFFAERPIGQCATTGAKLRGAGQIFAVDSNPLRLDQALRMGTHSAIDIRQQYPVEEILKLTGRRWPFRLRLKELIDRSSIRGLSVAVALDA